MHLKRLVQSKNTDLHTQLTLKLNLKIIELIRGWIVYKVIFEDNKIGLYS